MFSITNPASQRLAEILKNKSPEAVIRFKKVKSRLRLRVGKIRASDQTFDHEGRTVLALDEPMAKILILRKLDVTATDKGPRLRLKPNENAR